MDIDAEKLEQTILALFYLNSFDDKSGRKRAWKGFPWSVMDQLHEEGYIAAWPSTDSPGKACA